MSAQDIPVIEQPWTTQRKGAWLRLERAGLEFWCRDMRELPALERLYRLEPKGKAN